MKCQDGACGEYVAMADYKDVPEQDFPLTVVVTDEAGTEIHRTTMDRSSQADGWDDVVSKDLDERYEGKKSVKVTDVNGKTVHEAK